MLWGRVWSARKRGTAAHFQIDTFGDAPQVKVARVDALTRVVECRAVGSPIGKLGKGLGDPGPRELHFPIGVQCYIFLDCTQFRRRRSHSIIGEEENRRSVWLKGNISMPIKRSHLTSVGIQSHTILVSRGKVRTGHHHLVCSIGYEVDVGVRKLTAYIPDTGGSECTHVSRIER